MASFSALLLRRILVVSAVGLGALPAMAQQSVNVVGSGGSRTTLTSASTANCTSLQATAGNLIEVVNTGPATTVFLTLYDEGASPACAAADLVYGDGTALTIGAGQVIRLFVPLINGLAYKLSGSLSNNLIIVRS